MGIVYQTCHNLDSEPSPMMYPVNSNLEVEVLCLITHGANVNARCRGYFVLSIPGWVAQNTTAMAANNITKLLRSHAADECVCGIPPILSTEAQWHCCPSLMYTVYQEDNVKINAPDMMSLNNIKGILSLVLRLPCHYTQHPPVHPRWVGHTQIDII